MQASITGQFIRGAIIIVAFGLPAGWLFFQALKKSEDPARLIFKWILTIAVIAGGLWKIIPMMERGGYEAAFGGIPLTAVCGLALAIIWRHSISSMVAKPFTSLYDGGDEEIEARPYYSIAEGKRKKGKYDEAAAEVRKQLEKFPNDFEGQMKLAEIQAENLHDMPGAQLTIERLCNQQPAHPPRNIVFALNTLADWHLKYGLDREAARMELQKIIDRFSDSEFALLAQQRIAHLGSTEMMLASKNRQVFAVPEGVKNIGLMQSSAHLRPPATNAADQAAEYVKHLESHPQDTEAREKLAILYADHYQRLELATDQLYQLINQPNQPTKSVIRWLNLLADLQVRGGADYETVRGTLEQIIQRYPTLAAANQARNRLELLRLEMKSKEERPAVKMGTYEQNIGLKQSPRRY